MKKILIFLISIIITSAIVIAGGQIINEPATNSGLYDFQYSIHLYKGWNLISYGENFPFYMSENYVGRAIPLYEEVMEYIQIPGLNRKKADSPVFVYLYNPETKGYIEMFPENTLGENTYMVNYASWVYVREEYDIEYFAPSIPPLEDIKLLPGWNFVAINPHFEGNSLEDIKGTCNIQSVYFYNAEPDETQRGTNWKGIPLDFNIPSEIVGLGLIVKVGDVCKLGTVQTIPPPPSIPN
ncbi:hypothetical protein GOV04_00240 [Candidatus Woesearchaeota archaeon]|nr:hypothetical protein [Candidatus Woesearchaeota archaeon]